MFAGLYPVESHEHGLLRDALEKLRLNDSAFNFEPESSTALGFGFRCGFLGLLHLEIVQERLEREFNINLITTAPSVRYRITTTRGEILEVDNPTQFPNPTDIDQIEEPIIDATVITREEYLGGILALLEEKRGVQKKFEHIGSWARAARIRAAAQRDRARFLRSSEIGVARLCVARLSFLRLPCLSHGAASTCWWRENRWMR